MKFIIGLIVLLILALWLANLKNVWSFNRTTLGYENQWNLPGLKEKFKGAATGINEALDKMKAAGEAEWQSSERAAESSLWLNSVLEKVEELASSSVPADISASSSAIDSAEVSASSSMGSTESGGVR